MTSHCRSNLALVVTVGLLAAVAGLSGACSSNGNKEGCAKYCSLALDGCTANNKLYDNEAACMTACAAFPATGADGDAMGNTLQCRTYHAEAAGADQSHCAHASVEGGRAGRRPRRGSLPPPPAHLP